MSVATRDASTSMRKTIPITATIKTDQDAGEPGSVEAVFSTFDVVDHHWDVVARGAIPEVDIPMVWSHRWNDYPIGRGSIHTDTDRAVFQGRFFLDTTHGEDAYKTVKAMGDLQEWSWAFTINEAHMEERDGEMVRVITKTTPDEVSPVLRGAGIGTRTLDVKSTAPVHIRDIPLSVLFTPILKQILSETEAEDYRVKLDAGNPAAFIDLLNRIYEAGRKAGGRTLAEDGSIALAAVAQFSTRLQSLVDIRAKDGRRPSAERREQAAELAAQLSGLKAELTERIAALDDLVDEPDESASADGDVPPDPPGNDEARRIELARQIRAELEAATDD